MVVKKNLEKSYEKDIVEYIQAEQMAAMSSLVEVLKNGKRYKPI